MSGYLSGTVCVVLGQVRGLDNPLHPLQQAFVTTGYRFSAWGQIADQAVY